MAFAQTTSLQPSQDQADGFVLVFWADNVNLLSTKPASLDQWTQQTGVPTVDECDELFLQRCSREQTRQASWLDLPAQLVDYLSV